MIEDWARNTQQQESEFPMLLKCLGSDWKKRFL